MITCIHCAGILQRNCVYWELQSDTYFPNLFGLPKKKGNAYIIFIYERAIRCFLLSSNHTGVVKRKQCEQFYLLSDTFDIVMGISLQKSHGHSWYQGIGTDNSERPSKKNYQEAYLIAKRAGITAKGEVTHGWKGLAAGCPAISVQGQQSSGL